MDPQQPVVGGRHRDDPIDSTQLGGAVRGLKPGKEPGHRAGADGHMPADLHVPQSELTRPDARPIAGVGVFDPEQVIGQALAKLAMKRLDECGACGGTLESGRRCGPRSTVQHGLDLDVGTRFELEPPLRSIRRVVGAQRAVDVDRMGVVALDEVAVVAVHRPHEGSDLRSHVGMKLSRQPMRPGRQIDGQVFKTAPMRPASRRQHRLHASDRLVVVSGRGFSQHGNCRMHCRITG